MPHSRSIYGWLIFPAILLSLPGFAATPMARKVNHPGRPAKYVLPHRLRARIKTGRTRQVKDPPFLSLGRRDPFAPLLSDQTKPGQGVIRPPGKAGLMIDEIDVQGTVRGPRGAVAVVSNPEGHVYFLRSGDRLFDGTVEQINLDNVVFVEPSRDAFGRTFDRHVTKAVQSPGGVKR